MQLDQMHDELKLIADEATRCGNIVKNLLGHSTIVLTSNTYGHVLEKRKREVARAMDAVLGR